MTYTTNLLLSLLLGATPADVTKASPQATSGTESLGGQLLDDLPLGMPTERMRPHSEPPRPAEAASETPAKAAPRYDEIGEDIGQPSGPLPLVRAREGMQQASVLLGQSADLANVQTIQLAGKAQSKAIAQLDELIAMLSKQCQGVQGSAGDRPPVPQASPQTKPAPLTKSDSRSNSPGRDSNDALNRAGAEPADMGDRAELVKRLWGHLPARSREQMLQSYTEEFLPKYQLEIEQYYRRLSEMPSPMPAE